MGMGLSPPLPIPPPQCPPPLRVCHFPPSSPGGRSASLGTGRRRLSGPRPQNAEVPRSGRCVCPRHTGFGLSLARVAALTPAAWTPPVAYGVHPVPAPCDLPRPRCFGPLLAAPPPHLMNYTISAEVPSHLASPITSGSLRDPSHLTLAFYGRYHPLALFPRGLVGTVDVAWETLPVPGLESPAPSLPWTPFRRGKRSHHAVGLDSRPPLPPSALPSAYALDAPLKIFGSSTPRCLSGAFAPLLSTSPLPVFGAPYTSDVCLYTRPSSAFSSC